VVVGGGTKMTSSIDEKVDGHLGRSDLQSLQAAKGEIQHFLGDVAESRSLVDGLHRRGAWTFVGIRRASLSESRRFDLFDFGMRGHMSLAAARS